MIPCVRVSASWPTHGLYVSAHLHVLIHTTMCLQTAVYFIAQTVFAIYKVNSYEAPVCVYWTPGGWQWLAELRDRHTRHVSPPHSWVTLASSFSLPRRVSIPSEGGGQLCKVQDWRSGGKGDVCFLKADTGLKGRYNGSYKNTSRWPLIRKPCK